MSNEISIVTPSIQLTTRFTMLHWVFIVATMLLGRSNRIEKFLIFWKVNQILFLKLLRKLDQAFFFSKNQSWNRYKFPYHSSLNPSNSASPPQGKAVSLLWQIDHSFLLARPYYSATAVAWVVGPNISFLFESDLN